MEKCEITNDKKKAVGARTYTVKRVEKMVALKSGQDDRHGNSGAANTTRPLTRGDGCKRQTDRHLPSNSLLAIITVCVMGRKGVTATTFPSRHLGVTGEPQGTSLAFSLIGCPHQRLPRIPFMISFRAVKWRRNIVVPPSGC